MKQGRGRRKMFRLEMVRVSGRSSGASQKAAQEQTKYGFEITQAELLSSFAQFARIRAPQVSGVYLQWSVVRSFFVFVTL